MHHAQSGEQLNIKKQGFWAILLSLVGLLAVLAMSSTAQAQSRVTEAAWRAVYYNNTNLSGQPVFYRDETALDHNWGNGSPDASVTNDNFSARWTRIFEVSSGDYRFSVTGDDGVRVFLNDELILNGWWDHGTRTFTVDRPLSAGKHEIRVEYYERSGSALVKFTLDQLSNTPTTPPPAVTPPYPAQPQPEQDAFVAEYFNNTKLEGSPAHTRQDTAINFVWEGSPAPGINADLFSVRWTRNVFFNEGLWRFKVTADDGVRLYVDNVLVIDKWRLQSATTYEAKVPLAAGVHTIRMEFFEQERTAVAKLAWEPAVINTGKGNLVTCVPPNPPNYAWIRVYRKDGNGTWYRAIPRGVGSIHPTGYLKIDGLAVDIAKFGGAGEPYWIEQWIDGKVARSVGNTSRGEPEFRIRAGVDNYTPWQCGQ